MITPFWRKYICMFKNLMQKTNRNRRTKSWYYNFHILSICKIVFTSYKHMEQISIHNKSLSHVRENKIISAAHTVCCQFIDRKYCKWNIYIMCETKSKVISQNACLYTLVSVCGCGCVYASVGAQRKMNSTEISKWLKINETTAYVWWFSTEHHR